MSSVGNSVTWNSALSAGCVVMAGLWTNTSAGVPTVVLPSVAISVTVTVAAGNVSTAGVGSTGTTVTADSGIAGVASLSAGCVEGPPAATGVPAGCVAGPLAM